MRAFLLDTQGPEIRTGNVKGGGKIQLEQGATIELTTDPVRDEELKNNTVLVLYQQYLVNVRFLT